MAPVHRPLEPGPTAEEQRLVEFDRILTRPGDAVVREDVEFERNERGNGHQAGQHHQIPNDRPMASRKVFDFGEIHGAGLPATRLTSAMGELRMS